MGECKGCTQRREDYETRLNAPQVVLKPLDWFQGDFPTVHQRHVAAFQRNLTAGVVEPVEARPDGTVLRGHGKVALARLAGAATLPTVVVT